LDSGEEVVEETEEEPENAEIAKQNIFEFLEFS